INQTEALVAIDVNSGRATREHSIEETARKTNLEAADEVGRQLRLRDLAGLIVIDFIDMEEGRNDREVEKRLRDAVKDDRARVQIGKISQFGLLEMSRQRLRVGVVASSTVVCPSCGGAGIIRSVESTALRVLRAIEEEGEKSRASAVTVRVANDVAIYTLNQKRRELARIEAEYGMEVSFEPKEDLMTGHFELERTRAREAEDRQPRQAVSIEAGFVPSEETEVEATAEEEEEEEIKGGAEPAEPAQAAAIPVRDGEGRRRRRRGGRGRHRDRPSPRPENGEVHDKIHEASERQIAEEGNEPVAEAGEAGPATGQPSQADEGGGRRRRRRRGRRGGRNREQDGENRAPLASDAERFGTPEEIDTTPVAGPSAPSAPVWTLNDDVPDTTPAPDVAPKDDDAGLKKKGWWQRTFSGG
ncbi:MAG: ribonuclease E/G, partial [Rhizomicrobium sp.]